MNISCAYLTFSLLSSSPILSLPISSYYTRNTFNKLHISNLFTTFYYRSTIIQSNIIRKSTHLFSNSNFHHLLSHAIRIDSDNILSYQKPLGRLIFSLDFTRVDNCIFQSIYNPTNFGGALMTFSGLEIKNSQFLRCSASEGGALSCHEDFLMSRVSFDGCTALSQSGAFDRRTGNSKYQCSIELCGFSYCKSDYFGCFYSINQGGPFQMKFSNISQITAKQCVGCFESTSSTFDFRFTIISSSVAGVHNGCIVIRKTYSIYFDRCLFMKCAHSSFVSDAGAVLLVYDNPMSSYIQNSFFIFNSPSDSYTISVTNGYNKLKIVDSYFTGSKNKEINLNSNIEIDSSDEFDFKCDINDFNIFDDGSNIKDTKIIDWKNKFKENVTNNKIGCLTINFDNHGNQENVDYDLDKEDIDELMKIDENDPQDFFLIHFIAIILAILGAFLLQFVTNCALKLYQTHKNSRENE